MAKKKVAESDSAADDAVKNIERLCGSGSVRTGRSVVDKARAVIPMSPILDVALSGGIPEGSWVTVSGAPKCGKSSTVLTFCANAQVAGRTVMYIDVEGRINNKELTGIQGLDIDKLLYVGPEKGKLRTSLEYLEIAGNFIKAVPGVVVVFDSLSAMGNPSTMGEGLDKADYGSGNKIISRFCDVNASIVPVQGCILVGIVHLYANTSGYGPAFREKVANRWTYQADVILRAKGVKPWTAGADDKGPRIGQIVTWEIGTSALGPPGAKPESYLRYGVGIDKTYELLQQAVELDLVKQAGAWFAFDFLGDAVPLKFQGLEKAYAKLNEDPEAFRLLAKQVKEMTS